MTDSTRYDHALADVFGGVASDGCDPTEEVPQMRRVVVESPYAGDVAANVEYAKQCVHDSLTRGEAPIASHLLFTQDGLLDDDVPSERLLGCEAGLAWLPVADLMAVYVDRGVSGGMERAVERARRVGLPVEFRLLAGDLDYDPATNEFVPPGTGVSAGRVRPKENPDA